MRATTILNDTRIRADAVPLVIGQCKTFFVALTECAALDVYTLLFAAAVVDGTFINILANGFRVIEFVSGRAAATEAAFNIVTIMRTNALIHNAFIDIDASQLIAGQLHSFRASARKRSGCIDALMRASFRCIFVAFIFINALILLRQLKASRAIAIV